MLCFIWFPTKTSENLMLVSRRFLSFFLDNFTYTFYNQTKINFIIFKIFKIIKMPRKSIKKNTRSKQKKNLTKIASKRKKTLKSTHNIKPKKYVPKVKVQRSPKVKVQRSPKVKVQRSPKVNVQRSPKVNVQPSPKVNVQPSPKVQVQPYPKVNVQPSPKVQVQPSPKVQVQPYPKVQVQPSPKVQVQPSPKVNVQPLQVNNQQIVTSAPLLLKNFQSCQNTTKPQKFAEALKAYKSTHYQPINSHLWTHKGKINTSVLDLTDQYDQTVHQYMQNLFELVQMYGVKSTFDFITFRNFLYSKTPSQRTIDYTNQMLKVPAGSSIPFHGFLSLSADTASESIPKDLKGVAIIIIPKGVSYVCPLELSYVAKEYEILLAPGKLQKMNISQIGGFRPPLGIWKFVQ